MARVLIMEDELTVRHELADGLRDFGHECDCVGSAPEAMSALQEAEYDIVLTDIYVLKNGQLVPEGGVSLIGWMRTFRYRRGPLSRLGDTPIIAITGAVATPDKQYVLHMAMNIGATIALRKPISIPDLNEQIGKLVVRPIAQAP